MGAFSGEGVEVDGERPDEGFAFPGLHLGHHPAMQDDPADHLDVEVPHLHGSAPGFAHHGKRLREELVQRLTVLHPQAELGGAGPQLLVALRLIARLELVDTGDRGTHLLDESVRPRPEDT